MPNQYVNKVDLADGTNLVDLSSDTAVQSDVASGKYFHLATGERVQGTAIPGVVSQPVKLANFIDYDGTILYSYNATEFASLSALPANPTHTGLTAQGWNYTKAQISTQLTAMPNDPIYVGQMYTTSSGATEVDITLDNSDFLSPYLCIAPNGTVVVDWGDGSSTNTLTGSSNTALVYQQHTYSQTGDYTIKLTVSSGKFTFYNSASNYAGVLRTINAANDRSRNKAYSSTITAIRLGTGANVGSNAFAHCYSMRSITIPSAITSIGNNAFYYCTSIYSITIPSTFTSIGSYVFYNNNSLRIVSIPSGVTSIGSNAFAYCFSMQSITLPSGVTTIDSSAFAYCYTFQGITIPGGITSVAASTFQNCTSLQKLTIPSGVTSIATKAFQNCYDMHEYHFKRTSPPTLANTDAFSGIMSGTVIYVPSAQLNTYKGASQWSNYSSYMQGE